MKNSLVSLQPSEVAPAAFKLKPAAQYCSISTMSMRRLIERGLIKPNKALRHILISRKELDRFIANN